MRRHSLLLAVVVLVILGLGIGTWLQDSSSVVGQDRSSGSKTAIPTEADVSFTTSAAPVQLPNLLVLLEGTSFRVMSGAKAAETLNSFRNRPFPKNLLMIQCDEFHSADDADSLRPLIFTGRVIAKASGFEATARKLSKTRTRFLLESSDGAKLESDGDEPAMWSRTGEDKFTLLAKRIEFDSANNQIRAGTTNTIQTDNAVEADAVEKKTEAAEDGAKSNPPRDTFPDPGELEPQN